MEPMHRRVEPVEPVELKENEECVFFRLCRLHRLHTPVHRFHALAPCGSIGSKRLRTDINQLLDVAVCPGLGGFAPCRGPFGRPGAPKVQKSNFKLVTIRPESDSPVTQLEIGRWRGNRRRPSFHLPGQI